MLYEKEKLYKENKIIKSKKECIKELPFLKQTYPWLMEVDSMALANTIFDLENAFSIGEILMENGWTLLTAINVMIFTLLHFPCGTTLLTIKKETKSIKWTIVSLLLPTLCGIIICFITTQTYNLINLLI